MLTLGAIVVDGVTYAAWLFLIGVGLTLVFGVLRILNIAHGAFYSFGAYAAAFGVGLGARMELSLLAQFMLAIGAALAIGVVLGFVVERCVLTRLYARKEALALLATYAVFLILEDFTKILWGPQSVYANGPRDALGQVPIGPLMYPLYDVLLVAAAALTGLAIWYVLYRTKTGFKVQAVVFDREVSSAMGIHVTRVMTATFVVGACLGTLAGALTAPKIAISPGIGVEVIVLAFAVVVIGGLGSISGAIVGACIVGIGRAAATHLLPQVELFVVYLAMAAVLTVRPLGLFARPEARKI